MAFVIKEVPDITVSLEVLTPGDEAVSVLEARWKLYDFPDAKERTDQLQRGLITDEELVAEDLLDLGPFEDEQGKAVPFSQELAQQLLRKSYLRTPLIQSWFKAQSGLASARKGN